MTVGNDETPVPEAPLPVPAPPARSWRAALSQRGVRIGGALSALVLILAVDAYFIVGSAPEGTAASTAQSSAAVVVAPPSAVAAAEPAPTPSVEPALMLDFQDQNRTESTTKQPKARPHYATVQQAAARSCSTSSVDGLSRQIIAQARCIDPDAFVALPTRPNLKKASHVYAYFRAAAQRHLLKVLDKHKDRTMILHSALRTIAQQYLVSRWAATRRCNIQLAANPGESNHETGLALDISQPGDWRPALEAEGFHWLGEVDRVHFDYDGGGASPHRKVDILAFQQLWNINHPDDAITEDGHYGAGVEQRLVKAPADGFPQGARCRKGH